MSTDLSHECNKFLHLFWLLFLSSHQILYILNWSPFLLDTMNFAKFIFLFLWGVLHHFICQQTLVKSVTSFYICSDCYSSHPTKYCYSELESISTWYNEFCQIYFSLSVGCFTSLHMSTDFSQECNKFLHLFWLLFLSSHQILYILNWSTFLIGTINLDKFI